MSNLSPVEALQRRINRLQELRDTAANIDGLVDELIFALELAKADAALEAAYLAGDFVNKLSENMRAARAKLYEALQR